MGKRAGCAAIAIAAVVTLGLSAHHAVQNFTQPKLGSQTGQLAQEQCIMQAIRDKLPKDAAFYIPDPDWTHVQRLSELSTTWAVPQASLATAAWTVTLNPSKRRFGAPTSRLDAAEGKCGGLTLEVRRA